MYTSTSRFGVYKWFSFPSPGGQTDWCKSKQRGVCAAGEKRVKLAIFFTLHWQRKGHSTIPNYIVTDQKTGKHPRKNLPIQAKWSSALMSTFPSPQPFNLCLISCVISGQWVKEQLNWIIRIISTCTASRLFACCMNHVQIEIIQEWDQTKCIS